MKKLAFLALSAILVFSLTACTESNANTPPTDQNTVTDENGTYRGSYVDGGGVQVAVEFTLKDNVITKITFRHLAYKGVDYLRDETMDGLRQQHQELIDHLLNKDVRDTLADLYTPAELVETQVDGFTSATLRSGKIISAIRDALNRGVYKY